MSSIINIDDKIEDKEIPIELNDGKHGGVCHWKFFDGEWYYIKNYEWFKELLGQKIAEYIGLDTVKYRLVRYNKRIYVASPNFMKDNCTYFYMDIFKKKCNSDSLDLIKGNPSFDYNRIVDTALKMFASDIYRGEIDRHSGNVILEKPIGEKAYIGPMFDYGRSFKPMNTYHNCILKMELDRENMALVFDKYPKLHEYLEKMLDASLIHIIHEICDENNIFCGNYDKISYRIYDSKVKRKINKML